MNDVCAAKGCTQSLFVRERFTCADCLREFCDAHINILPNAHLCALCLLDHFLTDDDEAKAVA